MFYKKQGEVIAKQYFEQAQTNDQKYHWTKGAKNAAGKEINITTFQGIQDNCDIDESWRNQYKLSCLVLHGSPQGTFNRLCLKEDQSVIAVGQSDYGITIAAEHSAISLQWITSMFLNVFPSLDAMVYSKVIYDWVEEVRKVYFSTADICFNVNEGVEHSE